jgi:hypothetical protein
VAILCVAMRWYPSNNDCPCEADITQESSILNAVRGLPWDRKRAKIIRHYREGDEARFWHWSDQSHNLVKEIDPGVE